VASDVKRLQPLEYGDSGLFGVRGELRVHAAEAFADVGDEFLRSLAAAGRFANPQNIAPDVAEVVGIKADDFRLLGSGGQSGAEFFRSGGTDVAEVLRENQVGSEFFEAIAIYGVDGFAALHMFADQLIGFGGSGFFREAGRDDRGFRFRAERKIAFVADANGFFIQAKSK
jgi:hypothetical protein